MIKIKGAVRRSHALLHRGDTFVFNGIPGEHLEEQSGTDSRHIPETPPTDRLITVVGISVVGSVSIFIDMIEDGKIEPRDPERANIHSVPYDLALRLIDDRVWQECEVGSDAAARGENADAVEE